MFYIWSFKAFSFAQMLFHLLFSSFVFTVSSFGYFLVVFYGPFFLPLWTLCCLTVNVAFRDTLRKRKGGGTWHHSTPVCLELSVNDSCFAVDALL